MDVVVQYGWKHIINVYGEGKVDFWGLLSKSADILGIISLIISVVTLKNTRKIRTSLLAHAETSEYREAIDEQVQELEAFKNLLIKGEALDSRLFLQLMTLLKNIQIAYSTILRPPQKKHINNLINNINNNFYNKEAPYSKKSIKKCSSQLVEVITELKKEKEML